MSDTTVTVTDAARKSREERAQRAVADAVKNCKRRWGGGWNYVSEDIRRGAVCIEVMAQIGANTVESAEAAVFCAAVATLALQVEL